MLGENLELLKTAMQTPAVVLRNGTRSKAFSASGDEVAALPPTQRCVLLLIPCCSRVQPDDAPPTNTPESASSAPTR
jgi:hypothetical protein